MRFILLILLGTVCFSASAQWYRLDLKFKKKEPRPAAIEPYTNHSIARLPVIKVNNYAKVIPEQLNRSEYSYLAEEASVMKTAQHNMRFRIYTDASYNFSELARLYIRQNRFSEAKWFLLQSNSISREQNDDKHTIANLIDLATIKEGLGDFTQAQADLTEAHDLANMRGFKDDAATIDKKMLSLEKDKLNPVKIEVRYAEEAQDTTRAE
jgi:hypothetical protein